MPDLLFPTDNEYGIPSLLPQQPVGVNAPVIVWGSTARDTKHAGTICFYCDDYRFAAVWDHPERVLASGAGAIVEPNYSVLDDTPMAVALWHTYRKRWLARYMQQAGLTVWVDLCVPSHFSAVNLIGVPRGWGQYATAAWDARVTDIEEELDVAKRHAAGYPFTLMVYGGGKRVTTECARLQAIGHPIVRVGHRSDARKRLGQGTRERLLTESNGID